MRTILCDHSGPMLRYGNETLDIQDLNPEIKTKWRMSRWEMFTLGLKCIMASILAP